MKPINSSQPQVFCDSHKWTRHINPPMAARPPAPMAAVMASSRHGPSGHPTGLDYAGCRAAVRAMGLKWRRVFAGLRVMDGEVLEGVQSR